MTKDMRSKLVIDKKRLDEINDFLMDWDYFNTYVEPCGDPEESHDNECLDYNTKRYHCLNVKKRERGSNNIGIMQEISSDKVESNIENSDFLCLLYNHMDRLPTKLKDVILLRDINGLSYEEIAQITQKSPSAIKMRVYRARKLIREMLEPILFPKLGNKGDIYE